MMPAKRKRIPLHEAGVQRLQEPDGLDRKKYHYRWINDSPGRIEAAVNGGYEMVATDGQTDSADTHSSHSIVNSRRTGQRSLLMRIPIDLYEEDQRAKEDRNRAVDDAITRQEFKGRTIENVYVPEGGGIKINKL